MNDTLTRFVLDSAPVRGGVVRLNATFSAAITDHAYPGPVARALGELLAATSLLGSSLKWEGSLILQLQSEGALQLLCAEVDHQLNVRAVATVEGEVAQKDTIAQMMPEGRAVITLDPKGIETSAQMYQGIVALNAQGVAATLEDYMQQSQQVRTCIFLASSIENGQFCAAGFLAQKLPGDDAASAEHFERIVALSRTLGADELLSLDAQTLLTRLFHEETVRVLPAQRVQFFCPCSEDRVLNALKLMGEDEVNSLLAEKGTVEARCQFCNQFYSFGPSAMKALFAGENNVSGSQTQH